MLAESAMESKLKREQELENASRSPSLPQDSGRPLAAIAVQALEVFSKCAHVSCQGHNDGLSAVVCSDSTRTVAELHGSNGFEMSKLLHFRTALNRQDCLEKSAEKVFDRAIAYQLSNLAMAFQSKSKACC